MPIFEKIKRILKSNINEMLDRAEEPDKMIRQMIRDMEEAVGKATASVGTAVANNKRLERQCNDKQSQIDDWQRKAERAVESGDDELARRALERKSMFDKASADLAPALAESKQTAEQLREQLRELKTKLEEAASLAERIELDDQEDWSGSKYNEIKIIVPDILFQQVKNSQLKYFAFYCFVVGGIVIVSSII